MRFPSSAVLAGFLVACATGETPGDDIDDMLNQTGGSSGSSNNTSGGGAGGSGSGSSSGTGGSAAGSFNNGGMPGTAGTFVNGGTSFSGSTFTGGTAGAATGGGGATAGGSGGTGGNATAGSAGSGGKAAGGTGGTGGTPATGCPAKTAWTATASVHAMNCPTPDDTGDYCGPPGRAIDGISNNRFSTGVARTGAEWLQIDFGKEVTVSGLTLRTAAGSSDYTLAYAVRMSNNAADIGTSAVIVSGAGMQGATVVDFPADKKGRYLRINQTMAMAGWWSVAELDVDCE